MIFPKDAQTKTFDLTGILNQTLITEKPSSILGVKIQQNDKSDILIYCGSQKIAHQFDNLSDYNLDLIQIICNDDVILEKIGGDKEAFVSITYVPYDINRSGSTTASFYNGFTYGEIINSIFIFLIFMIIVFTVFYKMINFKNIIIRHNKE